MERNYGDIRPQMNVLNSPRMVRINADSIGKYFLRLPLEFVISKRIYKQPVAESVVCGDIQRALVMFRVVLDCVVRTLEQQIPSTSCYGHVIGSHT